MSAQYTCDDCGGTFDKGWSDAEAAAEAAHLFPGEQDMAVVCDDCFRAITGASGFSQQAG